MTLESVIWILVGEPDPELRRLIAQRFTLAQPGEPVNYHGLLLLPYWEQNQVNRLAVGRALGQGLMFKLIERVADGSGQRTLGMIVHEPDIKTLWEIVHTSEGT